eukprot:CAMPEP_0171215702 /NCGR_PEP_ID=MMETSP0790-20130122/31802_1 /TAXON_ID=2925 /ORGANISM="Alexandrium catenella, Strain OF101" /LENGTH=114 /DNA_ID=CAMNT_0011681461 /DNA_START=29 /DNA_END=369 /DNA_ORIENTATION=-
MRCSMFLAAVSRATSRHGHLFLTERGCLALFFHIAARIGMAHLPPILYQPGRAAATPIAQQVSHPGECWRTSSWGSTGVSACISVSGQGIIVLRETLSWASVSDRYRAVACESG